jgi:hypothetical protein
MARASARPVPLGSGSPGRVLAANLPGQLARIGRLVVLGLIGLVLVALVVVHGDHSTFRPDRRPWRSGVDTRATAWSSSSRSTSSLGRTIVELKTFWRGSRDGLSESQFGSCQDAQAFDHLS